MHPYTSAPGKHCLACTVRQGMSVDSDDTGATLVHRSSSAGRVLIHSHCLATSMNVRSMFLSPCASLTRCHQTRHTDNDDQRTLATRRLWRPIVIGAENARQHAVLAAQLVQRSGGALRSDRQRAVSTCVIARPFGQMVV